jgi:hypothetical protein
MQRHMQIRFIVALVGLQAVVGIGVPRAQTLPPPTTAAPPAAPATPPPAYSPAAPASNAAVGTLRRQNRRQYLNEQQQRNEAEDALRSRARTAPVARPGTRTAPR